MSAPEDDEAQVDLDCRLAQDIANAIASALEAGWNKDDTIDLLEEMWPDMMVYFAIHLADQAFEQAKKNRKLADVT